MRPLDVGLSSAPTKQQVVCSGALGLGPKGRAARQAFFPEALGRRTTYTCLQKRQQTPPWPPVSALRAAVTAVESRGREPSPGGEAGSGQGPLPGRSGGRGGALHPRSQRLLRACSCQAQRWTLGAACATRVGSGADCVGGSPLRASASHCTTSERRTQRLSHSIARAHSVHTPTFYDPRSLPRFISPWRMFSIHSFFQRGRVGGEAS